MRSDRPRSRAVSFLVLANQSICVTFRVSSGTHCPFFHCTACILYGEDPQNSLKSSDIIDSAVRIVWDSLCVTDWQPAHCTVQLPSLSPATVTSLQTVQIVVVGLYDGLETVYSVIYSYTTTIHSWWSSLHGQVSRIYRVGQKMKQIWFVLLLQPFKIK